MAVYESRKQHRSPKSSSLTPFIWSRSSFLPTPTMRSPQPIWQPFQSRPPLPSISNLPMMISRSIWFWPLFSLADRLIQFQDSPSTIYSNQWVRPSRSLSQPLSYLQRMKLPVIGGLAGHVPVKLLCDLSKAFDRVIPSEYSISPPMGIPKAIRVTFRPRGLISSVR